MRAALLALLLATPALAQTPLDWSDGGEIILTTRGVACGA
jgi:hypothetical protein